MLRLIVFLLGLLAAATGLVAIHNAALLPPQTFDWLADLVGLKLVGPVLIFVGTILAALAVFFDGIFAENPSTEP